MIFTMPDSASGYQEFGNGVMLDVTTSYSSIESSPEKMIYKVNITLNHFNALVVNESFKIEMDKDASAKERRAFILESVEKFKGKNFDTIMNLKNSLEPETLRLFRSMMEEINELRDTVDELQGRVAAMD